MEFDMKSFSFHPEIEDVGKGVVHAVVSVLMGANRMTYTAGVKGLKGDSFDAEWLRLRKDFLRHRVDVCLGL